jgi:hypothetical protein
MVDFGNNSQQCNLDQDSQTAKEPNPIGNSNIATAKYSSFHIHQIKPWVGWSVNQEEIEYAIDPPIYLNA